MSYPPQQAAGGYPPQGQPAGGYPPPQGQPAGGYPPPQGQPAGGYPPPQGQPAGGYPSPQGQPAGQAPSGDGASAPEEVADYRPGDTSGLKTFEGYGNVGFEGGSFLPPPPPPSYDEQQAPSMDFGQAANITAEEARAALLSYVAENCCYGKGAAEQMEMKDINPSNAFHYTLETFCEGRTTARTEIPYLGDAVDGPFNGPPPMPWDITCAPTQQFSDQVYKLPVPHTAEVRMCGMCLGGGFVRCNRCHGVGRDTCSHCSGRGHTVHYRDGEHHHEHCHRCHGTGRDTCGRCHGNGRVPCPHCKGQGRVKAFIEMTITFKNYVTDYILEETAMPDELIRDVSGVEVFNQSMPQLWPITTFPVRQVNDNSVRLVEAAKRAHPTERQLQQRQILRAVPVTEVDYKFKDRASKFWVYGMQRKVHAPDYPQQCCCGCTIL
ncbi:protein SSUH2 homolog [Watersipora subatra]|uniref:protein SSUH2 homolog n=1 Tax=Watersipora subatra TaxID=2589382 RepID=UPI00355ACE8F